MLQSGLELYHVVPEWWTVQKGVLDLLFSLSGCEQDIIESNWSLSQTVLQGTWRRGTRTRLDSASSPCEVLKISVEDCVQDLLDRFHRSFCARSLCKAIFTRCLKEISTDLKVRSLSKLSIGDLWARSLFSSPGLCSKRSLQEVCWQDLCTSSL